MFNFIFIIDLVIYAVINGHYNLTQPICIYSLFAYSIIRMNTFEFKDEIRLKEGKNGR